MTRKNQFNSQLTQEQQTQEPKFKEFKIYADMSKVDRTWEKYGYLKAPLAVRKTDGQLSSRSHKNQIVIYQNEYKKLVSNVLAVTPHEFITDTLNKDILNELNDLKMYVHKEYDAHDGDSHFWTLLSEKKFQVDGNDNFQVGVVIRNGIGTNVSLGADLYTMRVVCENGAVMRGRNFGSFSIPHLGKLEPIINAFVKLIRLMYQKAETIPTFYEKLRKIKVNDEIATDIYKKMPFAAKYLPDNWNVTSRYTIKYLKSIGKFDENANHVEVYGKTQTLMDAFNTITEKQRDGLRAGRINFSAVSTHQVGLHNALLQIVNNPKRRA
jgi:hypothetical protein